MKIPHIYFKILILFSLSLIFNSYPESNNSAKVKSLITFTTQYMPELKKQEPLEIIFSTTEIYSSDSCQIITSKTVRGKELIINFKRVLKACITTAMGGATAYIRAPGNITKLTLINGDFVDQYSISLNNQELIITPIKNYFTIALDDKIFLAEDSFLYVCSTEIDRKNLCDYLSNVLNENQIFLDKKTYYKEVNINNLYYSISRLNYDKQDRFASLNLALNEFKNKNNIGITDWLQGGGYRKIIINIRE